MSPREINVGSEPDCGKTPGLGSQKCTADAAASLAHLKREISEKK